MRKLRRENGYISTLAMLLFIAIIFAYHFLSKPKSEYVEIGGEGYAGYLDYNTVTLNTLPKLESGEIAIKPGEEESFRVKGFTLILRRGKDIKIDERVYSCYLFETINERSPRYAHLFLVLGVPLSTSLYKYSLVYFRKKPLAR